MKKLISVVFGAGLIFVFFVVVAVVILTGCRGRSPTSPDGNGDSDSIPDQSQYETLPAKHFLKDVDGNDTKMWITLISVSPARGSGITLGPDACPARCFQFSIEVGFEVVEYNTPAFFTIGFGHDSNTIFKGITGPHVWMGSSQMVGNGYILKFDEVPEYLVVMASYKKSGPPPNPTIYGGTSFILDYYLK